MLDVEGVLILIDCDTGEILIQYGDIIRSVEINVETCKKIITHLEVGQPITVRRIMELAILYK